MKSMQKLLRGLSLVGQLGFLVITPPLVLMYLAQLLIDRHGWGVWVMLAALVVGLLAAASSVWSFCRRTFLSPEHRKKDEGPSSFNGHI